ncbi:MAG: nicotinate-nucleotide--dimethylbenzimidazole phosphoribosyltransferase [Clostridia bacterium]|nr:nicotinate-nucleotide--dimethylbenzimidazole phosphoribosyltransferase [Clostridia bacterium]
MELNEIISMIRPADRNVYDAALQKWDSLAKPLGSLGVLEEDITGIAACKGNTAFRLDRRTLLVFCADNGVTAQGVSQCGAEVTAAVAAALGQGTSTVNYMADTVRCAVLPVDIGMAEDTPEGVLDRKIRRGTADMTKGRAMTRKECEEAILTGVQMAKEEAQRGTDILLLGEMGIGNTTSSAAVASVLLEREPEEVAGRGAGLSDSGLRRKIRAIREAIAANLPDPGDPVDVLNKVGGLDLAALCGVCLGGALFGIPVLMDGMITNTAALCAVRLCPQAADALFASHASGEPASRWLLEAVRKKPCIRAGLRLGEGTGAVLALGMLDQALAVYGSGHTFGKLGIEAYTPQQEG